MKIKLNMIHYPSHIFLRIFLVPVLLIVSINIAIAQTKEVPDIKFEQFILPGGEWGNYVQSIVQDSFGFMWFGSQNGLHRWDGYQFKSFFHNPLDSTSIASNYIEYLLIAQDGSLWVGTWGQGLDHFDYQTETFTHYQHEANDKTTLSNAFVTVIVEDQGGNIWVSTQEGLNRLDPATGKVTRYMHNPNDSNSLSDNLIRALYMDAYGTLWVGTGYPWDSDDRGGLNRYDPITDSFTHFRHEPGNPKSLLNNKVTAISEDSRGNFWVGTKGDGLHLMNRETGEFNRLTRESSPNGLSAPWIPPMLIGLHMRFVFEDFNKKLWIGAFDGGFKYYDPDSGIIKDYYNTIDDSQTSLVVDNAWTMFQSSDGTKWMSITDNIGRVYKLIDRKDFYDYYKMTYPEDYVLRFAESRRGGLWVATENNGLIYFDRETGAFKRYENDPQNPNTQNIYGEKDASITSNAPIFDNLGVLYEDQNGILWMEKWDEPSSVFRFDPALGTLQNIKYDGGNEEKAMPNHIFDITMDENGYIWLAAQSDGLLRLDPQTFQFKQYNYTYENTTQQAMPVCLYQAKNGKLWIGVDGSFDGIRDYGMSLLQFDPTTEVFESFDPLSDLPDIEPHTLFMGIAEDKNGNIWMCTSHQLLKYDIEKQKFELHLTHFMGRNIVKAMTIDDDDKIWLINNGFTVYDPIAKTVFTFSPKDDINDNSIYFRIVQKTKNGELLFGGRSGFYTFHPDDIKAYQSKQQPRVLITEFSLFDQPVAARENGPLTSKIWEADKIQLAYNENVFSFNFSALDFTNPTANRHEFMLENYDENWRVANPADPEAYYAKVPPGEYTFRVRAANRFGVWSEEKSIRVIIAAPWWRTWWAYLLYGSAAFGVIFSIYRFQLNRNLAEAEAERLREVDTMKTTLYTNITHEFRTPLTIILGMAKQIGDDPENYFRQGLNMITRNGQSLLNLVNQMLDLSKLESGKMPLHYVQADVVSYLKYLVESFHSFAEAKGIQIHFLSDLDELVMDYDAEKLKQIVSNLLINAIKFTPEDGHIYLSVNLQAQENQHLVIKVRDTGVGIPEEQQMHIFDRFYRVDDSDTQQGGGTGIGLAITKELVKLMQGDISVKSKINQGTEFSIMLPIRHEATEQAVPDLAQQQASNIATAATTDWVQENGNAIQGERSTVLIIEDNPDVVAYLAACLHNDYHIQVGKDGQEGIEIATEIIPDLIISDVMMPFMDGFAVCKTLKNDERTSHIPIVMLTAKADMDSKLEGLEYGADAYLAKPFHKDELLIRVKKLLESRQKLQAHYLAAAGLTGNATIVKDIPKVEAIEDAFLQKARKVVQAHLDDFDFTVEIMCREIGMSHSQLHRKLTALTGLSANKFIRNIRLNAAKEMLQDQELTITAVAFDVGFNDPSYFGRVFKQEFGLTPQEWREQLSETNSER